MYIIYNSDGSIEKKSITEYIQQGNSYANVLFVTVKDTDLGDYTASAIVTLPNGQNVGAIIEEAEEPVEIDGAEYNGYYITLDETCTLIAGAIRISLSLTIEETRVVTYPIYLNVNATPYDADAPVMISYNQYLELLASIAEVTTPNNPTITLQKNGVTVGYFSLNQASNKTINYVLSKSDVGLGNVDNTSDATKKSDFTGSIAENDTGFVTGGALYTYLNDYHTYKASTLSLKTSGSTAITFENIQGTLVFNNYAFSNSSIRYLTDNTCDLGSSEYKFKDLYLAGNAYAKEYYIGSGTYSSLGREYGNTYIKTTNNDDTTKYYFATTYFSPNNTNAQDLGHTSYRWKDLYLGGKINFVGGDYTYNIYTTTTALKIGEYAYIDYRGTIYGKQFQLPNYSIHCDENAPILHIRHYVLDSSNGSSKFYHENSGLGNIEGAADLGTSDNPWADLYLSGKINNLTLPEGTHTLATLEDIERQFVLTTTDDIATVKAILQGAPPYTCYLSNGSSLTDITSAVRNGDYDNVTVGNPTFASTNQWVKTNESTTSHTFIVFAKNSNVIYFVIGANLKQLVTGTLFITDDAYPSRFHSNRDYKWYKL